MIVLLVILVFRPEFLKLLDDLIIFANLLMDGKQNGIQREHNSKKNP